MLRLISFQIGNVVNISEIANRTQLGTETVRKYLQIGEESFLFQFIPPFFSNKRKSLLKDRKVYFEDLGIHNHLAGQEVDFIIEMNGSMLPIEVKFQTYIKKRDFNNLLLFMGDFDLQTGIMISKDIFKQHVFDNREVLVIPLWLFAMIV